MRGLILVLKHPISSTTDPVGRFRLTGLPAGQVHFEGLGQQPDDAREAGGDEKRLDAARGFPVNSPTAARKSGVSSFRRNLLVAMMLVVLAMTGLGLFLAQRKVAIEAARDLQQDFRNSWPRSTAFRNCVMPR